MPPPAAGGWRGGPATAGLTQLEILSCLFSEPQLLGSSSTQDYFPNEVYSVEKSNRRGYVTKFGSNVVAK